MAGDKYIIDDQYAKYFITCTVVNWIDLFTRKVYRDIIIIIIIDSSLPVLKILFELF